MDTRPRTRLKLRHAVVAAALGALVVPATANAAVKAPVITKVTPANASVGETLTVTGRNFRVGKGRNTLLFKRDGGKALFVKAGLVASNGEARRQIKGGGLRVNDVAVTDEKMVLTPAQLTPEGVIKLSLGRKRHVLLKPA